MTDPLYEILLPYLNVELNPKSSSAKASDIDAYLNRLTTLSLSSLTTTEPESLSQTKNSTLVSLQALSKRSHSSLISSCSHLSRLSSNLPFIAKSTASLKETLPQLDEAAIKFSEAYNTRSENAALDRRRKALLLSRNVDRISSILELPTLLSSAISNSNQTSASTSNYSLALDLNAHIRRLHSLYPESATIKSVELQSEEAMFAMTTNLISSLKTNSLKLAGAMRTISWLRRISPELDCHPGSREGVLGSIFLVCRLANLRQMIRALEPLRELADKEKITLNEEIENKGKLETGQQTERYLKRYIEIFREQSFAIISMYRSIFLTPSSSETELEKYSTDVREDSLDSMQPNLNTMATFPLHLVNMLAETLKEYLPNVRERSSRDSLLTQVLYCASSLGRLGSDFSIILAFYDENDHEGAKRDEEWAEIIKKHRMLAGRLELMVGSSKDT